MRRNDSWLPTDRGSGRSSYYGRDRSGGLKKVGFGLAALVVIVSVLAVFQLLRKPPRPKFVANVSARVTIPGTLPSIPWPTQGAADVGVLGIGTLGNHGLTSPIGLASVAKIITALVIVHDHPISLGVNGSTLTVSPSDVATYQAMLNAQDSVMVVTQGEQISELQALEALLIPSADNVATMLANWDAGSVSAFAVKMNQVAKSLGMTSSTYADPSGLDSNTAGTAPDQLLGAQALLSNPVLSQIVAMPQATLPVAGTVYNVNALVGHDGITGVKTGSTPAGGNFAFAGSVTLPPNSSLPSSIASNPTIVGVILGQQGYTPLPTALSAGQAVLDAFRKVPENVLVFKAGQVIGTISAPGQANVAAVATKAVTLVGWPGLVVQSRFERIANLPNSFAAGSRIGTLVVSLGQETVSVPVVANAAVVAPSLTWRLKRL